MMTHVVFVLSMPNRGSWNGKWSGEEDLYCRVRSYRNGPLLDKVLAEPSHYYNFGDGWGARVSVKECTVNEKAKYTRKTKGFCGYDWMINEIEEYGTIRSYEEREEDR
jgi:hypothetical protein